MVNVYMLVIRPLVVRTGPGLFALTIFVISFSTSAAMEQQRLCHVLSYPRVGHRIPVAGFCAGQGF